MGAKQVPAAIIGGGPIGLATTVRLCRGGTTDVVVPEREKKPEGILRRYIHDEFGLARFKETLSGSGYAQRFMDMVDDMGIPYITDTTVLEIIPDKRVYAFSREGVVELQARTVILTTGCRERTEGTMGIPGERSTGVYIAGVAQIYVNLQNKMVGREMVILGSGDIGVIVTKHLTLERAHAQAVFETQPYSSGFPKNIEQCLRDYDIPSHLSCTVTDTLGKERLEGMVVSQVDDHMQPVLGSEETYVCDILILSAGLIFENELSLGAGVILDGRGKGIVADENYWTGVDGIFAAGNVLHVHNLVDFVSREAERLGDVAAEYARKDGLLPCGLDIGADEHVTHTIPQEISGNKSFYLSLRVRRPMSDYRIQVLRGGRVIKEQTPKKANPTEMIQVTMDVSISSYREDVEVKVV